MNLTRKAAFLHFNDFIIHSKVVTKPCAVDFRNAAVKMKAAFYKNKREKWCILYLCREISNKKKLDNRKKGRERAENSGPPSLSIILTFFLISLRPASCCFLSRFAWLREKRNRARGWIPLLPSLAFKENMPLFKEAIIAKLCFL